MVIDSLFSRLCLPEPAQVALSTIDAQLAHIQAQRNRLLVELPSMAGLAPFSVALDLCDEAFQELLQSQEVREGPTS